MNVLPTGKFPNHLLKTLLDGIPVDDSVIVGPGIGRDAAAVRVGDSVLVLKTDPITFAAEDIGWYLVNINANDIACMGAEPRWLLVTALLPEASTTPELVEAIFNDLQAGCQAIGCNLIGGHTEVTEGLDRPILVGNMIGEAEEEDLADPTTAQPGDAVILAGGIAIEGTAILATESRDQLTGRIGDDILDRASRFLYEPGISVVDYARVLRRTPGVTVKAMHDPTEGGLATGLDEIAQATGLGISIDAGTVHVYPETAAICSELGLDPWGLIASGALLAVVPRKQVDAALDALREQSVTAGRIGELTGERDERILLTSEGLRGIPEFAVDEIARYFSGLSD